jgi:hypothetical protein
MGLSKKVRVVLGISIKANDIGVLPMSVVIIFLVKWPPNPGATLASGALSRRCDAF